MEHAHPVRIERPLDGAAGLLPELLLVAHYLWRVPDGDVVRFYSEERLYSEERPDLMVAATELPAPGERGTLPGVYATVAAACR